MKVKYIGEAGVRPALHGLGLSYKTKKTDKELYELAKKLCDKDGGHNKFLEMITVWVEVQAPLYWWKQFDTYRVGVTKQSESTMHTIMQRELTQDDFHGTVYHDTLRRLNDDIRASRWAGKDGKQWYFTQIVSNLPDGYLQTRMVCLNYKVLRHMFLQRKAHKLPEWQLFMNVMYTSVKHKEFLQKAYVKGE